MSQKSKLQKMLGQEAAADVDRATLRPDTSVSYFDISEDEDSRFYQDERKYMPLFGRELEIRKGTSRKALKWLGLA
jgi:hypothetical protein